MGNHRSSMRNSLQQVEKALKSKKSSTDGSEKDGFYVLEQSICAWQETVSEVLKCIRENKSDVAKDHDTNQLIREYIDNTRCSTEFYCKLVESVRKEKARQSIIQMAFRNVAPGGPPLSEAQHNKIKEKLVEFINSENPFKDFQQLFAPVLERHEGMREKLEKKIEELGRKRETKKVWKIVSGIILQALKALLTVCREAVRGIELSAPGVEASIGLFSMTFELMGKEILSFLEEKVPSPMEEAVPKMKRNTSTTINRLKETRNC